MRKLVLIALLALLEPVLDTATAGGVYERPKQINGIYCFVLGRPLSDFEYIRSLSLSYPDSCEPAFSKLLSVLEVVKSQEPAANGVIFFSLDMDSVALIKLK